MANKIQSEIAEVMRLRDDEDLTFKAIGLKLGFSERTAQRRYKVGLLTQVTNEYAQADEPEELPEQEARQIKVEGPFIPTKVEVPERFEPIWRQTNDVMVTADWHVPLYDPDLANVMINVARQNKIKGLIIAGDFWNMDTFSSYLPHQPEADFSNEKPEGNLIFKHLLETFEWIDVTWGNHDFRLTKFLGYKHSFADCMKWALSDLTADELSRIRITDLDYMHLYTDREQWRICHPRNFSTVPLSVPRALALKYNCSVMTGHSHHCAMGVALDGQNLAIDLGGLLNKNVTEYIQQTNKFHEWVTGFVMVKDAIPHLFSPQFGNTQAYEIEVK